MMNYRAMVVIPLPRSQTAAKLQQETFPIGKAGKCRDIRTAEQEFDESSKQNSVSSNGRLCASLKPMVKTRRENVVFFRNVVSLLLLL